MAILLLRFSMVVDGIKESRTHMGSTDTLLILYYCFERGLSTGEEVSIDKQVACEECPRWLKMTEVA